MYIFPTNYLYHPFRLPSPAVQQDVGLFAQLQHHFVFWFDNLIYLFTWGKKINICQLEVLVNKLGPKRDMYFIDSMQHILSPV